MVPTLSPSSENSGLQNTPLTDRRRRSRLAGETLGWLLPAQPQMKLHLPDEEEGWEVIIHNLSRFGVGFASTEPLRSGEQHRLRIGRGPIKRARLIRVVACRQNQDGTWTIGAEFIDFSLKGLARAG